PGSRRKLIEFSPTLTMMTMMKKRVKSP
ncbi:uncharacterized protein METZ01_LOCUS131589, partial [marine metagenome]